MLGKARKTGCPYGCCKSSEQVSRAGAQRAREEQAWRKALRRGEH